MTAGSKARHETVSRTGTEAGADIAPGGGAVEHDRRRQHARTRDEAVRVRQKVKRSVDDEADHHDVADGAEPRTLPQWDPSREDDCAHGIDHPADLDAETSGDALVQYVPRVQSQPRLDEQGQAHAEGNQACVQEDQSDR